MSKEVSSVTLCKIFQVYNKVRAFTYAEKKVEKHEQKSNKNNSKATRKKLKSSICSNQTTDLDMQCYHYYIPWHVFASFT